MTTPHWFVNLIKKFFPTRFFFSKFTHLPLLGNLMEKVLFEGDHVIYLPKDNLIPVNQKIDQGESIVLPSSVLDYFIDKAKYCWIMDFCICREGSNCQDYPHDMGCIFLGEPVLKINPELGHLVSSEEAKNHARKARESGLVHMIGRNRIDSIWLGTGHAEKLMTICHCCPCCCLWKVVPNLRPSIREKIQRMPGVEVKVNKSCIGCGQCADNICFVGAIQIKYGRAVISDQCLGCGRCVEICQQEAIDLQITDVDFIKNAIQSLDSEIKLD